MPGLSERFRDFAAPFSDSGPDRERPPGQTDELYAACLVAEALGEHHDEHDDEHHGEHFSRVLVQERLADLKAALEPARSAWAALARLGFSGNRDAYQDLRNSDIGWVLAERRGIPITLAIVLIEVARSQGQRAVGINHPGHFLVSIDGLLIDPFAMAPVDLSSISTSALDPAALAEADGLSIAMRMLNNLKALYASRQQWHRALDMVSYQLAMQPEQALLWSEKGDLWAQLGGAGAASRAYRQALGCAADADPGWRQSVEARLRSLKRPEDETLH